METIKTIAALEALYGRPLPTSTRKVAAHLVPEYRAWIERSRFCILSTVGPEGTDASPRGDDGPVVRVIDEGLIALPDWRGNDRIDSLRNILRDPRVSLMFMIPGATNVIRVNGIGAITADAALRESFARGGKVPRTVVMVSVREVYFQCARAILRAGLWSGIDESAGLPTPGRMLAALTEGEVGGPDYDAEWPDRAARSMW